MAVSALLFVACSAPKDREITVSGVEITGTIDGWVKVVDGTYQFTNNGRQAFITVEFEMIEQPFGEVELRIKDSHPEIRLDAIDARGNIIQTGVYGFEAGDSEARKLEDLFIKGRVGDRKRLSFTWQYFGQDKEQGKLIFTTADSFEIQDEAFEFGGSEAELIENGMMDIPEPASNNTAPTQGTDNWDRMLDSYERYVDQYISYLKKIQEGDISVMTEYGELLEKTTDLSEKMDDARGELSSAQMKRYLDITNKFSKGIVDLAE